MSVCPNLGNQEEPLPVSTLRASNGWLGTHKLFFLKGAGRTWMIDTRHKIDLVRNILWVKTCLDTFLGWFSADPVVLWFCFCFGVQKRFWPMATFPFGSKRCRLRPTPCPKSLQVVDAVESNRQWIKQPTRTRLKFYTYKKPPWTTTRKANKNGSSLQALKSTETSHWAFHGFKARTLSLQLLAGESTYSPWQGGPGWFTPRALCAKRCFDQG